MAGLGNFQRYNKGDFPDAPEWLHRLMDTINQQIENITTYLQGNGSISEIFNIEERDLSVKSDVEVVVGLKKLKGKPTKAYIVSSTGDYPLLSWRIIDRSKVGVKVKFATSTSGDVRIRFEV
jgi:hypothetical protein